MSDNPGSVTIGMATYNHERYIAQAIESVLMQQTTFSYTLLIAEDCSTDRTREICLAYQRQYPERINVICNERNFGVIGNQLRLWQACLHTGDYTAFCEGDDYWTDPYKLQKQADFLETHPDFAITFHNAHILYEDAQSQTNYTNLPTQQEISTLEDLARGNYIYNMSGVMVRNGLVREFPAWFQNIPVTADYPFYLLHAQYGKIKFFPEVMSSYRVHSEGVWKTQPLRYQVEKNFEIFGALLGRFDEHTNQILLQSHIHVAIRLAKMALKNKDRDAAQHYLERGLNFPPQAIAPAVLNLLIKLEKRKKMYHALSHSFSYKVGNLLCAPFKNLSRITRELFKS